MLYVYYTAACAAIQTILIIQEVFLMDPAIHDLIIALRHRLHAHPELSLEERWTKATLMDLLRAHTQLEVVDCGAWFYAVYHTAVPTRAPLAFRADFDALPVAEAPGRPYCSQVPGLSHACGHDGHAAALCGLALSLEATGADRDVFLLFQHAEEIGAGGEACADFLRESPVTRVYAMHNMSGFPEGTVLVRDGLTQCASCGRSFYFHGQSCHASQPEDGRNPAFAVAELTLASRRFCEDTAWPALVMATVVHAAAGQEDFGIAAGDGQLSLTLRAARDADLARLDAMLCEEAARLAEVYDLRWETRRCDVFPETRNDPDAAASVREAARSLGLPLQTLDAPWRASEDFGWYTKVRPGAMFYIGNGIDHPALHTADYDFNDAILDTAVAMFRALITVTP